MLSGLIRNVESAQEVFHINSLHTGEISLQIESCLSQLLQILDENGFDKTDLLKQTYFIKSTSNENYYFICNKIREITSKYFTHFVPVSFIPQSPLDNKDVMAEYIIFPNLSNDQVEVHKVDDIQYLSVKNSYGKFVIASNLGKYLPKTDIYQQSDEAFKQFEKILQKENLTFSNVIRQWNYIEDIVGYTNKNQHYQIFNDVRSSYYSKAVFSHGYPAATGIGMEASGVIIDFLALMENDQTGVVPIKSPVQADAHQYSKEVLAHNAISKIQETTPKFERAKVIFHQQCGTILVSGTAAIKGQNSALVNAAEQTELTLNNIFKLIEPNNLVANGYSAKKTDIIAQSIRVYIKDEKDYNAVKTICNERLEGIPVMFVKADICRPELLVEIEGIFSIG